MNDNRTASGGIGFLGLLTIAFVVLRLCKVIAWSWWWVLCPIWGGFALLILVVLVAFVYGVVKSARKKRK